MAMTMSHENSIDCIGAFCYKADIGGMQKHIDSDRLNSSSVDKHSENKIKKYINSIKNKLNHIPHKLKDETLNTLADLLESSTVNASHLITTRFYKKSNS